VFFVVEDSWRLQNNSLHRNKSKLQQCTKIFTTKKTWSSFGIPSKYMLGMEVFVLFFFQMFQYNVSRSQPDRTFLRVGRKWLGLLKHLELWKKGPWLFRVWRGWNTKFIRYVGMISINHDIRNPISTRTSISTERKYSSFFSPQVKPILFSVISRGYNIPPLRTMGSGSHLVRNRGFAQNEDAWVSEPTHILRWTHHTSVRMGGFCASQKMAFRLMTLRTWK